MRRSPGNHSSSAELSRIGASYRRVVILGCGCPLTGRTVPRRSATQWQPECPSNRLCMQPSRLLVASLQRGPAVQPLAREGQPTPSARLDADGRYVRLSRQVGDGHCARQAAFRYRRSRDCRVSSRTVGHAHRGDRRARTWQLICDKGLLAGTGGRGSGGRRSAGHRRDRQQHAHGRESHTPSAERTHKRSPFPDWRNPPCRYLTARFTSGPEPGSTKPAAAAPARRARSPRKRRPPAHTPASGPVRKAHTGRSQAAGKDIRISQRRGLALSGYAFAAVPVDLLVQSTVVLASGYHPIIRCPGSPGPLSPRR
jgi:hypothetical protein